MKSMFAILSAALLVAASVTFVRGQDSPAPAASATPGTRTDVYHVHFTKAALGKAAQLADFLKTPDPKAQDPGHFVVLRHQQGDAWDYVVIEHLGTKATVEPAGNPAPPAMRDLSDWHNDTFVSGPAWADFARAMGIDSDSKSKSTGSVYVVSVYRPAPGHRDQLEKMLGDPPPSGDTSVGNIMMQHLEGSPWSFLTVVRYKSWPDFATSQVSSEAQTAKNQGGWSQLRDHVAFHNDTMTDRIAP